MSTAGACGATEVCHAILLEDACSTHMCLRAPFWHLGQPIEAPNFFTIAPVMYILRPLTVIGVFAMSV